MSFWARHIGGAYEHMDENNNFGGEVAFLGVGMIYALFKYV